MKQGNRIFLIFWSLIFSICCGALSRNNSGRQARPGKDNKNVSGLGQFQVRLLEIKNIDGVKFDGSCCDGVRRTIHGSNRCPSDNCDTLFRICLQHHQEKVQENGGCTLGNSTTPVLGKDSFHIPDSLNRTSPGFRNPISMHFKFWWLIKFNLIVEAWDSDNETTPGAQELIERDKLQSEVQPGLKWVKRTHNGPSATIKYEYRVTCDINYYGAKCTTYCKRRDDRYRHYSCDGNGDRVCLPGWTGPLCNKAVCRTGCQGWCSTPDECSCGYGWEGPLCNQCTPHPDCKNGTCTVPWECQCMDAWGGTFCDKDLKMCSRQKWCIKDQGTCINSGPGEYSCICKDGFTGKNCEQDINECLSIPCQNNGTCKDDKNNYSCQCRQGWEGRDCETNINDCVSNVCKNGGVCQDKVNNYECKCSPGWKGKHCETNIDDCSSSPCVHATNCTDLQQDFSCVCESGWKGKTCNEDVNDCVGQCQNGGQCKDLVNGYQCLCPQGFSGTNCEENIDDCLSAPCLNNGTCVDGDHNYSCVCTTGFQGPRCANSTDECASQPCVHGECIDGVNDYRCVCNTTYYGTNCSKPLGPSPGPCYLNNQCKHGATCISESNTTKCLCLPGYMGDLCQTDVDDCVSNPCLNSRKCVDRVNDFECICLDGYEGSRCEVDVDECAPDPCQNATCENLIGSYKCHCPAGFTGLNCDHRIDFCATGNPCKNGGFCKDGPTNYSCVCSLDFTGAHCETAVQRCDSNPCQNAGVCIDVANGYVCNCSTQFAGSNCELKIDHCVSKPCMHGGVCTPADSGFRCSCAPGHTGDLCEKKIKYCNATSCLNGGACVNVDLSASCVCVPGYEGHRCETDTNDCEPNPCKNNATCEDGINRFRCHCRPGTQGTYCEEEINECLQPLWLTSGNKSTTRVPSKICGDNGDCHPLPGGNFTCSCHKGYTGARCQYELTLCESTTCANGGECVDDFPGSFHCNCVPGYTGPDCSVNVDECESFPCFGGGECKDGINSFTCTCTMNRYGALCEKKRPDNCKRHHIERNHGLSWRENCNTCTCNDGAVTCTQVLCPPQNCISRDTNRVEGCEESGSRCVEMKNVSCLRAPCPRFGQCLIEGKTQAVVKLKCDPATNRVTEDCAKVHLVFSREKLPKGTLLPDFCRDLSSLDLFHRYAKDKYIKVTCDATPAKEPVRSMSRRSRDAEVTVAVASDEGTGNAVKAATDLAKYVKLHSEFAEDSNQTIVQIIFAITKVTVEKPVVIIYRREKETPVYLIPVIAALVVIAAFVLLLVIMCERRRRKQRERNRRRTYEETAKLKRRDSEDAEVETASEASRGVRKDDSFTELRDIEPEEIDVSNTEPTERQVSRIEVLSPSRTPRESGARDEWRRREVLNLQKKSDEEIIV